jgi:hypothetical protein
MASSINASTSAGVVTTADTSGVLNIQTAGTTAVTVDASQNVGINNTTPSFKIDAIGSTTNSSGIVTTLRLKNGGTAANDGAKILFTAGTSTDGAGIGSGGQALNSADLRFYVGGSTQAMTLDTNGTLNIDQAKNASCAVFTNTNASLSGFSNSGLLIQFAQNTTNNSYSPLSIYNSGAGAYKFRIADSGNVTNTNNSYGAISDAKLKENIVDATPKLADLMQVKVRSYNLKSDPLHKQLGVIAQELEAVFPGLVDESPDYEQQTKTREVEVPAVTEVRDNDGNITTEAVEATTQTEEYTEQVALGTITKSVKYSVFVPMLIKAMQEQQALITQLTDRITALESA